MIGKSRKILSTLLVVAMVFGLFSAMPMTARAANPVTINIALLTAASQTSAAGDDAWSYNATTKVLTLTGDSGNYTLTGTNTNLSVNVAAANANVTLDNVSITSNDDGYNALNVNADGCTITLIGTNTLTTKNTIISNEAGLGAVASITIASSTGGSLTLTGSKANDIGIDLNYLSNVSLNITGNASVTASAIGGGASAGIGTGNGNTINVGQSAALNVTGTTGIRGGINASFTLSSDSPNTTITGALDSGITAQNGSVTFGGSGAIAVTGGANGRAITSIASFKMGDDVTLTMTNNSGGPEINTFERSNAASTYQWKLTGNATTADNLNANSISVTVSAGQTGTVSREAPPAAAPAIVTQPSNRSIVAGQGTTFSVTASGNPAPNDYQWYVSAGGGFNQIADGSVYSGATTATLVLTNVPLLYNGYKYYCVVGNGHGNVMTNTATLTVTSAPVVLAITNANSFATGAGGSFPLTATGTGPITWTLAGAPAGVTINGSTLNVAASVPAGTYTFTITASNNMYSDATLTFTLTVTAGPHVTVAAAKDDTPAPPVPVLYDIVKSGNSFIFKAIIANGIGSQVGKSITVKLNERYSAAVTIGADGVGNGTLEAPGFTGGVAVFSARINGMASSVVSTPMLVTSSGKVVKR